MFNLAPVPTPDLNGRTILVTGAGQGIGAALVKLLGEHGARVYAGVLETGTGATPPGTHELKLDVTSQADVDAAIARIEGEAGRLDALVNNAGVIAPIGHFRDIDTESLGPAFAVNVLGVHRMTRAALPLLTRSGGVVVNAGTGAATTPIEGWTGYCSSKAAARMLTLMCAEELKGTGVQFFFIGIPPTDTAMQARIRDSGLSPISRIPKAALVDPMVPASVMAWLCGPEARSIGDVLLDVRDERFKRMMLLPATP